MKHDSIYPLHRIVSEANPWNKPESYRPERYRIARREFGYVGDAFQAPATHEPSPTVSALRVGIGIAVAIAVVYVLLVAALAVTP